ncbi:MAG: hypothetical protein E2581_08700 [Pseudomonas sp.]|uniref:hypothetical protein n=1 Tax=Pseudomonas sp. TaxID=306 RepID=UPI001DF90314|nr:hypothetical protein [Pseudomonas sp.]MPS98565.1 hypothetical protein [Pseudomonas sp.]
MSEKFKITEKVMSLLTSLMDAGLQGEARLTNTYCTGAREILGASYSMELTGFSKETLCVAEDEAGNIVLVGRYAEVDRQPEFSVKDIVQIAYGKYRAYKPSGYDMPHEFRALFVEHGLIAKRVRTVEEWEES